MSRRFLPSNREMRERYGWRRGDGPTGRLGRKVSFAATVARRISDKAIVVDVDGREVVLPISQATFAELAAGEAPVPGERYTIEVPAWLATREGIDGRL